MANPHPKDNFKNFKGSEHKLTKEDARKGGINSQKKQAELKSQKELWNMLLKEVMSNGKTKQMNLAEKTLFTAFKEGATFSDLLKFWRYKAELDGELIIKQEIKDNRPIIIKTTKEQEQEANKIIDDFINNDNK